MALEIESFLAAKDRTPSTERSYRDILRRYGRHLERQGLRSFAEATPAVCADYQSELLTRCCLPQGERRRLSLSTARTVRVHAEAFHNWLGDQLHDTANPWSRVRRLEHAAEALRREGRWLPEPEPRDVSDHVLEQLFHEAVPDRFEAIRDRALMGILVDAAPRRAQLQRLDLRCLRLDDQPAALYIPADGKSAAHIEVVSHDTRRWLLRYLWWRKRLRLEVRSGALFSDRGGAPLSANHLTRTVARMAVRLGLDQPISPHRFRHALTRHLKECGEPDRDIMARMGWRDSRTPWCYGRLYRGRPDADDRRQGFADHIVQSSSRSRKR